MNRFNGGIIRDSVPHPRGNGRIAVRGYWTGGEWKPGQYVRVDHYREQFFLGFWKITGVEVVSHIPHEFVLILSPEGRHQDFLAGDVVVIGQGACTTFRLLRSDPEVKPGVVLELGGRSYRSLVNEYPGKEPELVVFHEIGQDFELSSFSKIKLGNLEYNIWLYYEYSCFPEYTVELRLGEKTVPIGKIIDTLAHARGFVLIGGSDLAGIPKTPGRYPQSIIDLFEPGVSAMAGSVRIFLHSAKPITVTSLDRSEPLRLFATALSLAASGDSDGLLTLLKGHLKDFEPALKHLKDIVKISVSDTAITIQSPDVRPVELGSRALSAIESSEETIKKRTLTLEGEMYSLESRQRWCRFSSDSNSDVQNWTLRFAKSLVSRVKGKIPRMVSVEFETHSTPDVKQGSGVLLSIKDIE